MTEYETSPVDAMYVQNAGRFTLRDDMLVLRDVAVRTLFFSDHPQRVAGHISTWEFIELWPDGDEPDGSFADDPPTAVLAFEREDGESMSDDAVVVLREPSLADGTLQYHVEVVDGLIPSVGRGCALFIDPVGRPITPLSVAGMRRRVQQRLRRGTHRRTPTF
jgi:hypothetical protein